MTELNETGVGKKKTPLRAIREKCLDCCCGSSTEVDLCPCEDCSLYPFRYGKNPNIHLSDEERERRSRMARENLAFTQHIKSTDTVGVKDGKA